MWGLGAIIFHYFSILPYFDKTFLLNMHYFYKSFNIICNSIILKSLYMLQLLIENITLAVFFSFFFSGKTGRDFHANGWK